VAQDAAFCPIVPTIALVSTEKQNGGQGESLTLHHFSFRAVTNHSALLVAPGGNRSLGAERLQSIERIGFPPAAGFGWVTVLKPDTIQLPEPRTPLYPLTQQRMAEAARPLAERLRAWRMMNSQASLRTTYFSGKLVSYQGAIEFDGAPRQVFWDDFFEPFMFDAAQQTLEWVIETCRNRNLAASKYLAEATALLSRLVTETYHEMARTDQLLRGRGYPDSVAPMRVTPKIEVMHKRISDLAVALVHRGPSAPPQQEVLSLKPTLWGIGVDLKALWRRLRALWRRRFS